MTMELLFGRKTFLQILAILFVALTLVISCAEYIRPSNARDYVLLIIVADLSSGLISNATRSTQQAWLKVRPIFKYLFIIFHLFVYPFIIFAASQYPPLTIVLLATLLVKTCFFILGQRKTLLNRSR